jgi:hypothetical protein
MEFGASVADPAGASNGIELRPRGAPPPAPPRSFLAERGEFDPGSKGIGLASARHPLSRPLPQKTLGERRIRPRLGGYPAVLPPPRGLWGRPGRGAPTIPRQPLPSAGFPALHQPPPAVLGEVGKVYEPGGGAPRSLPEHLLPYINLPQQFRGEVGEVYEPGGGAPRSLPEHLLPCINLPQQFWGRWARFTSPEGARLGACRSTSCPASTSPSSFGGRWARFTSPERARLGAAGAPPALHQPPPAVSGEVGEVYEPGGGAPRRVLYTRIGRGRSHSTRRARQPSRMETTASEMTSPAHTPCAPMRVWNPSRYATGAPITQ